MADNQEKTPQSTNQDEIQENTENNDVSNEPSETPKANEGGASSSDNAKDQNATPRRRSKTETVDVDVHHPNGGYENIRNTVNSDGSEIHSHYLVLGEQEYELVTYRKKSGATSEHEYLTNISDVEDFKRNFLPPQKTKIEKIEDQTTEGEKTEKKKPWFGWFGWGPKKDQDTSSDDED